MDAKTAHSLRAKKVLKVLKTHNVGGLIISNIEEGNGKDIEWLTGFSGTASVCFLTSRRKLLITDPRYAIQVREEVQSPWKSLAVQTHYGQAYEFIKEGSLPEVAAAVGSLQTADKLYELRRELRPTKIKRIPNVLQEVQEIKDELDIFYIRQAVESIEYALEKVFAKVRPGVSELELERELLMAMPFGATHAFDAIVASGVRSAMPHGVASDKLVEKGDIVQFDVGCNISGYNSDISRVVVVGKATAEHKSMHRAICEAIESSMKLFMPGSSLKEASVKANDVIVSHGYPSIPHGLGHGIGLRVHEAPQVWSQGDVFKEGQVVTNEPGIYIEGYGGMRIERDVLITKDGPQILDNKLTTDLLEL